MKNTLETEVWGCRTAAIITPVAACLNAAKVICAWGLLVGTMGLAASAAPAKDRNPAEPKAMLDHRMASAKDQTQEAEKIHATVKAASDRASRLKNEAQTKLEQARITKEAESLAAARATCELAEKQYALVYAELHQQQLQKIEADKKLEAAEAAHLKQDKDPLYDAEFDAALDRYLSGHAQYLKAKHGNAGLLKQSFALYANEKRKWAAVAPEARRAAITQAIEASDKKRAELALQCKAKQEEWATLNKQYQTALADYKASAKTPQITAKFTAEQDYYYDSMRNKMRDEWGNEGFLKTHVYPLQLIYRDRLAGLKGAKHAALTKATQALEAENKALRARVAEANQAWALCADAYKNAQRRYFLAPRVAAAEQRLEAANKAHGKVLKAYLTFMARSKAEGAKVVKARMDFAVAQEACRQNVESGMASLTNDLQKRSEEFDLANSAYAAAAKRLEECKREQARLGYFAKICASGANPPASAALVAQVIQAIKRLDEVEALRKTGPPVLARLLKEKELASLQFERTRQSNDPCQSIERAREQSEAAKTAYDHAPCADADLETKYQSLVKEQTTSKQRHEAANAAVKETAAALGVASAVLNKEEKDYLISKDFKPENPVYQLAKNKLEQAQKADATARSEQKEALSRLNRLSQELTELKNEYATAKRIAAAELAYAAAQKSFTVELEKADKAMPAFLAARKVMTAARDRYALKSALDDYLINLKLRVVEMTGLLAEKALAGVPVKKTPPKPKKKSAAVPAASPESEEDRMEESVKRTIAIAEMICAAIEQNHDKVLDCLVEYNSLNVSHAKAVKAWAAKSEQDRTARAGFKDAIEKSLEQAYHNALKDDGWLTPRVRYAFMAMRQYEAVMELHRAGIHLPDELLCWVDFRGVVGATVYGMRFGRPAVCLAMLRSLELDFGREKLNEFIQPVLGLIYAPRSYSLASLKNEQRPGQFSLKERPKFNLVIPGRPTPWEPTVPAININHHVINFLENEETLGSDGRIVNETRRKVMLTAHQVFTTPELKAQFIYYMERHGHEVEDAYACLRGAYIQTGRRQSKGDSMPTLMQWFAFHVNHTPDIKNYPWPISYFALRNIIPMREALALKGKGRETEKYVGGGRYGVNNPLLPYDFAGATTFWHRGQYGVCWRSNIMVTRERAARGQDAFKSYSPMHVDTVYFVPRGGGIYTYLGHGSQTVAPWPYGAAFSGSSMNFENKGKMMSLASAVGYGVTEYSYSHLAWMMADLLPADLRDKYYVPLLCDGLSWNPHNDSLLQQISTSVKTMDDMVILAKDLKKAQERAAGKTGVSGSPASLPKFKAALAPVLAKSWQDVSKENAQLLYDTMKCFLPEAAAGKPVNLKTANERQ